MPHDASHHRATPQTFTEHSRLALLRNTSVLQWVMGWLALAPSEGGCNLTLYMKNRWYTCTLCLGVVILGDLKQIGESTIQIKGNKHRNLQHMVYPLTCRSPSARAISPSCTPLHPCCLGSPVSEWAAHGMFVVSTQYFTPS